MQSDQPALALLPSAKPQDLPQLEFAPYFQNLPFNQYACDATEYVKSLQTQIKDLRDELAQYRKSKPDRAEIIASVTKELKRLPSVNSAYYVPFETRDLDIIVLHNSRQEIDVLDAVVRKISDVEDEFPDVDFRPVVLSLDQVGPDTLTGAQRAF